MIATLRRWTFGTMIFLGAGCARELPPEVESPNNAVSSAVNASAEESPPAEALDLQALFDSPRAELAARCVELEATLRRQDQARQEGTLRFTLLPTVRLPLVPPIFREANYKPDRGISLPPYLKADGHDSAIAYHVGRHGDVEAALKLVEPGDDDTIRLIREGAYVKNYPLEWTRLIAMTLHGYQVSLAAESRDAVKNILHLQTQLRAFLDDKAKQGPLGAALLGRGLGTLRQAGQAWKAINRDDLDEQIRTAVASLSPAPKYAVELPRTAGSLSRLFGVAAAPNAVVAVSPARVADLLNLYLPTSEVDVCAGFIADGRSSELLLTYRPPLAGIDLPRQLAEPIEDLLAGQSEEPAGGCPRRTWAMPHGRLEVVVTPRNASLGAVARFVPSGAAAATPELPRDFGPVHLDRTFEANRRLAAWTKRGATINFTEQATAAFGNPAKVRPVTEVVIDREATRGLVDRIRFDYAETPNLPTTPAGTMARRLFETLGQPKIEYGAVGVGAIDFVWTDPATVCRLQFPYAKAKPVVFDVRDVTNGDLDARLSAAAAKDAADRLARLKANRPQAAAPRQIDNFKLGMTRLEFKKALPRSSQLVEREIPGGMMAALLGKPDPGDAVAREWFGRFDDDKLVELRIRYDDMPGSRPGTFLKRLDAIKAKLGPAEGATVSAGAWSDLPKRGASALFSWHDDLTLLTCQQEPHGMEVVLRDCPAKHPEGVPLAPLAYLPKGTADVVLGMPAAELVKLGARPTEGNAYLIEARPGERYDVVVAWIENGQVVRIRARHKDSATIKNEAQAANAILTGWARDAQNLGWPHRQDLAKAGIVQNLATRDDVSRFRLFWDEADGTFTIFSEWKELR